MIDGPIPVMKRDPLTGELTDVPAPGVHYNVTEALMAERPELEAYRVTPSPLQRVWAGDPPEAPQVTVPLRFASETEANDALYPHSSGVGQG